MSIFVFKSMFMTLKTQFSEYIFAIRKKKNYFIVLMFLFHCKNRRFPTASIRSICKFKLGGRGRRECVLDGQGRCAAVLGLRFCHKSAHIARSTRYPLHSLGLSLIDKSICLVIRTSNTPTDISKG